VPTSQNDGGIKKILDLKSSENLTKTVDCTHFLESNISGTKHHHTKSKNDALPNHVSERILAKYHVGIGNIISDEMERGNLVPHF